MIPHCSFFFFFFLIWLHRVLFIYFIFIFIFGCVRSSFLCEGFLQLWQAGATHHRGAQAPSLSRPLLLWSTGSRRAGSVAVAPGPSCSAACGILPDQGSNPCPLHWQADSQPLRHQGSPQRTSKCQQEVKEGDKNVCPNQEQVSPRGDHEKCLETYEKISREN